MKNYHQRGGSTVDMVETIDMVYTVDMVYKIDMIYTVDMVYSVDTGDEGDHSGKDWTEV